MKYLIGMQVIVNNQWGIIISTNHIDDTYTVKFNNNNITEIFVDEIDN